MTKSVATGEPISEIVRRSYKAFADRDRQTVESLMAEGFSFTSPYDDHIDKASFFERCWPFGDTIAKFHIVTVTESGDRCVIVYDITTKDGRTFRNAELLRVSQGKIQETEVFFGALPEA